MRYIVEKIDEDIDFGCEERADDMPVQAVVTLRDENGEITVRKFSDAELMKEGIQSGDAAVINEDGQLKRVPQDDWTKNCNAGTVDIPKFVSMMEAVKAGQTIEWTCPFCGGEVKRLEQKDGHTVIGCTACDMRINLEQN